jgi:hypothetical protein
LRGRPQAAILKSAQMAGSVVSDTSAWPLVVVRFSDEAGPIADEMYQTFFDAMHDVFQRGSQFAIVADIHMGMPASAKQRRMLSDWLRGADVPTRRWAVGLAVVVRPAVIRGGLRAVFWIKEPALPPKVVASLAEGVEYCLTQLDAHRVAGARDARQEWKASHSV